MSEADFAVTADMAAISRVQYELDYTEGISQKMRIPDRLKVGPGSVMDQPPLFPEESHSTMMQVPDRIIVAGIPSSVMSLNFMTVKRIHIIFLCFVLLHSR